MGKSPEQVRTPYNQEMQAAIRAVRAAAKLCQRVQPGSGSAQKGDSSPVTVADFGSQAVICRMLSDGYPGDPVVAEEDASDLRAAPRSVLYEEVVRLVRGVYPESSSQDVLALIDYGSNRAYTDRFWTLDPVDGTKGFLGGRNYAVALALVVEGRVRASALACPDREDPDGGSIYAACEGGGALRVALRGDTGRRTIRVSRTRDVTRARFCESFEAAHTSFDISSRVARKLGISVPAVRMDSQAKYAVVARGDAEVYLRLPSRSGYVEKIWDHAAGTLILTEAGGTVTDVNGQILDFSVGARLFGNRGVVATNGRMHAEILGALPYS